MPFQIVDLTSDRSDLIDGAAVLLRDAFHNRSRDWQNLESARQEVMESLSEDLISRVAVDESGAVIGWIGAIPAYSGNVWEIHPLVVASRHRRQGLGRALLRDLEDIVYRKGALTIWAASDDENNETSFSAVDLYADLPAAIRNVRNLRGHPYEFYVRAGFRIVGVMPDANGVGKPDIFLAKRVTQA
jgi:aminoglycoside 6'-N-acetyltransferase I